MPAHRTPRLLLALIFFGLSTVVAFAADPDPIELLRRSAEAVAAAPSASVELSVTTRLVRDELTDDLASTLRYRTAPEGRFEFVSVADDGEAPKTGYRVAGNSDVTVTALLGRRRHMLEPNSDGFAAFVRSPAASGIGSGLGGLALAFLHPVAMTELVESILKSEFVGAEEVEGERLLHARYTVNGGVTADIWFTDEDTPLVRRIAPDVLATPGIQKMAERYEDFDYQLRFEFRDWETNAGLTDADIRVTEPSNSLLMTSLYQAPKRPLHSTLGESAPAFELPTPDGETVSLGDPKGEGATLIEFWAISCPICIQAMPRLEALHEEYSEQGLDYYAVNVGDSAEDVAAFLDERGLTPTALIDAEGEVADQYDVGPIPLILLVDGDGTVQVAREGFGPTTEAGLVREIEATLGGDDLAAAQLEEQRQAKADRLAERKRLQSLLDG